MAKIFGYSLKKVKTFRGHDGTGLNADVYYQNKHIAYFTDAADGGEPDIDFTPAAKDLEAEMEKSAKEYAEKYTARYWNDMPEWGFERLLPMIVDDIVNLNNFEKLYKTAMKKNNGKEVMFIKPVFAVNNYKDESKGTYYQNNNPCDANREGTLKQMYKDYPAAIGYDIYISLDCFNIDK
jgi:hypothetical protein